MKMIPFAPGDGRPDTISCRSSRVTLVLPTAVSNAPEPVLVAQPPDRSSLPHGQLVPKQ